MRGRLGILIGFGAGYVMGAKAGRERYEQLRRLYENLISSPQFREARGKMGDAVGSGLGQAKDMASQSVGKVTGAIKERRHDDGHGLSVAPPPST